MSDPTVWCPSCGAEYRVGSTYCSDCRVSLVAERPAGGAGGAAGNGDDLDEGDGDGLDDASDLVEMGEYSRLSAQILRRRLESAGISVMIEWTGPGPDAAGTLLVTDAQAEFAEAVIDEIPVEDEVAEASPDGHLALVEEHLATIGSLLEEVRTMVGNGDEED
ncbi:MAG: hypothetical protein ACRDY7_15370 [Acidimicrobiia bacterium]